MNYYLVDYENASDVSGLYGVGYLGGNDCLIIFFSQSNCVIRTDIWNVILQSGCQVKMYKLQTPRENALDFYIAAEAASLFEKGFRQIAIISNDKDLDSVTEFLRMKDNNDDIRINKANTLESAISSMSDPADRERRARIIEARTRKNLSEAYKEYKSKEQELSKRRKTQSNEMAIRSSFDQEEAEVRDKIVGLWRMVEKDQINSFGELYKYCRRIFGSRSGIYIYRELKQMWESGQIV